MTGGAAPAFLAVDAIDEYTQKGERKHLNLEESDMNYKDLLKAMKQFNVKGAVVCESPNIEDDAQLLKNYYLSL